MTEEQTNRKRGDRAKKALVAYLVERDGSGCRALRDIEDGSKEQLRESASDLMCDLMHLLATEGAGEDDLVDDAEDIVDYAVSDAQDNWGAEALCSACDGLIDPDWVSDGSEPLCKQCSGPAQ